MNYFIKCITKKYVTFSGRAVREEFWMFFLFTWIFYGIGIALDMSLGLWNSEDAIGIFSGILILVFFFPYLAVTVRRFHDINKSGWFVLITFIPLLGWIAWLIWMCTEGSKAKNRFGKRDIKKK